MEQLVCTASSPESVEYFKKHLADFAPIKKFTSFFDSENFLLTEYRVSMQSVHTVVENFRGGTIEFTGLICGYNGAGPRCTIEVLTLLGINREEAEQLILNDAVRIEFCYEQETVKYSCNTDVFFNGNVRNKELEGMNIGKYCWSNIVQREVYVINPELHSFNALLDCLHIMKPLLFEYVVGKRNYLIRCTDMPEFMNPYHPRQYPQGTEGVNLIIRGEMFDVKCFIDNHFFRGTLNAIYLYLTKASLFEETDVAVGAFVTDHGYKSIGGWLKLLWYMHGKKGTPIHRTLIVDDKELKRDVE